MFTTLRRTMIVIALLVAVTATAAAQFGQTVTFTATVQPIAPSASDHNVELVVKILNAPANGPLTLTAAVVQENGALSNIQTTMTVTDTQTGMQSGRISLTAFAGQTIRIRIATTNNRGKLVVAVDDVAIPARVTAAEVLTRTVALD